MTKEHTDGLYALIFKMVNNHALQQNLVQDPNFRVVIDWTIKCAHNLQGNEHVGLRKLVTTRCNTFDDFTFKVLDLVSKCRDLW